MSTPEESNSILNNKKVTNLVLVVVIIAAIAYFVRSQLIVATVNGKAITRKDLVSRLEEQGAKQILDRMITETLILQEAKKQNIEITPEELYEEIGSFESKLTDQGRNMEDIMASNGISKEDLANQIKFQMLVDKMSGRESTASAQAINEYIEANKDSFSDDIDVESEVFRAQVAVYLVSTQADEKAEEWLNSLKAQSDIRYLKQY